MEQLCGDFIQGERSIGFLFEDRSYSHLLPQLLYLQLVKFRTVLMFASSLLDDDDTRCEFYSGEPGRDVSIYKSLKLLGAPARGISKTLSILSIAPFALFESLKHLQIACDFARIFCQTVIKSDLQKHLSFSRFYFISRVTSFSWSFLFSNHCLSTKTERI